MSRHCGNKRPYHGHIIYIYLHKTAGFSCRSVEVCMTFCLDQVNPFQSNVPLEKLPRWLVFTNKMYEKKNLFKSDILSKDAG